MLCTCTCTLYNVFVCNYEGYWLHYVASHRVFTSARKVLQGACHMVAMQLAAEPLVRQAVRQVFQTRAVLSVKPTKKGKKARKIVVLYCTCFYTYMYMYVNFHPTRVVLFQCIHVYIHVQSTCTMCTCIYMTYTCIHAYM